MSEQQTMDPGNAFGEVRFLTWSPWHYLCVGGEAPFTELDPLLDREIAALEGAREASGVRATGPIVVRYKPAPESGKDIFWMGTGFPVAEGTPAPAGTEVQPLPAFRCATLLFCGGLQGIQEAYDRLFRGIAVAGLARTGEGREWHLYFEGDVSPNNVIMLQQGVR